MSKKLNIAIAGATGFVGLEIIKKIYNHPNVNIKYLFVKNSIEEDIFKELPKNISATSLLDPQLSTSYSTRAPPTI